jgi:hypothetical protein
MANEAPAGSVRPSKLFWVIGVVALLWNGFGALDYTMCQTRNAAWMKMMTPQQVAYLESFPAWAVAAWAVGVWGGVVGSLLLLSRKKLAAPVYLASLIGALVSQVYTFVLSNGLEVMGGGAGAAVLPALIVAGAIGLWLYARAMAAKGVLG